jgi:hypothetical protein
VCATCAFSAGGTLVGGIRIGVRDGDFVQDHPPSARHLCGPGHCRSGTEHRSGRLRRWRSWSALHGRELGHARVRSRDQTFASDADANADTERATKATAGLVLFDGKVPAAIYYSASCGGRTELPSAVWPGSSNPPHLPSRDDDACRGFPAWSAELAAADLQRALTAAGIRGTLRDMRSRQPRVADKVVLKR